MTRAHLASLAPFVSAIAFVSGGCTGVLGGSDEPRDASPTIASDASSNGSRDATIGSNDGGSVDAFVAHDAMSNADASLVCVDPAPTGPCECGTVACVDGAWTCVCPSNASPTLVSIDAAHPHATFEGWGMSLAWEANVVFGNALSPAELTTTDQQAAYMDLLYNPDVGLGLTVARYNIGGGENPTHHHMQATRQMDGYLDAPPSGTTNDAWAANAANYNWTRDASQRLMLANAATIMKAHGGSPILEAFSNSPPYWMTNSGCASGNSKDAGSLDNLNPANVNAFVSYLTTVVAHFKSAWSTEFRTLEPFNEPDGWWWVENGTQEGCAFSTANTNPNAQTEVVTPLAAALAPLNLSTTLAVTDANNVQSISDELNTYKDFTGIGQVNTHAYSYQSTHRVDAYKTATMHNLRISMSEVGTGTGGIAGALQMADTMRRDMAELQPTTWSFWQTDWGVVTIDGSSGTLSKQPQFFGLLQYMKFIRPGFAFMDVTSNNAEDANTLAAYNATTHELVIVVENPSTTPLSLLVDVSPFEGLPETAVVYRTSSWRPAGAFDAGAGASRDASAADGSTADGSTDGSAEASAPLNGSSTPDGSLTESLASLLPVSVTSSGALPVDAPPLSITTFVFAP
jgi:hypothetical protein